MSDIDNIIHAIRSGISDIATSHDGTDDKLVKYLSVKDTDAYDSVIDSFYLLEDTQLAKHTFMSQTLLKQEFGLLYLLFYGVLNACYMQQQALFVIFNKLNLTIEVEEIINLKIFDYRNSFSAHSSNRGRGTLEHSFILDRFALREGKVKGYSSNHKSGIVFKEAKIHNLLKEWDAILEKHLVIIKDKI